MKLTNLSIQKAKPSETTYKLYDGKGLYLEITPTGSKRWRFKYVFLNKEKRISLGTYPEINLSKARELLQDARKLVAEGFDPSEERKKSKAQEIIDMNNTLEASARAWWREHMQNKAETHKSKVIRRFELYVFPYIGKRKISELTPPDIAVVVKKISEQGYIETAKRTLQTLGQVFRFAVQNGFATRDVTADLKGFLPSTQTKHMATLLKEGDIADFLKACEACRSGLTVKSALELAPYVFCRPGELRKAKWKEINFELKEWTYLVKKGGKPRLHTVPLSTQALEILQRMHSYSKKSLYVFPNLRSWKRPMCEAAVNAAIKSIGYSTKDEITGHGFRAMARTLLHETLRFDPNAIEHQLSHGVPDQLGEAYNRTLFMDTRIQMMQAWADYLDGLRGIKTTSVYFDCEFTELSKNISLIKLISAGFLTEDGNELYFELYENFKADDCSDFTKKIVLPNLSQTNHGLTNRQAAQKLKVFIESIPGKVKLASDAPKYDWHLISKLLREENCWPSNLINEPINLYSTELKYEIDSYFYENLNARRHHALDDVKALLKASSNNQRTL